MINNIIIFIHNVFPKYTFYRLRLYIEGFIIYMFLVYLPMAMFWYIGNIFSAIIIYFIYKKIGKKRKLPNEKFLRYFPPISLFAFQFIAICDAVNNGFPIKAQFAEGSIRILSILIISKGAFSGFKKGEKLNKRFHNKKANFLDYFIPIVILIILIIEMIFNNINASYYYMDDAWFKKQDTAYLISADEQKQIINVNVNKSDYNDSVVWKKKAMQYYIHKDVLLEIDYEMIKIENAEYIESKIKEDAVVFYVNESNPLDSIDIENVKKIFTGDLKNWKRLNGKDCDIVPFRNRNFYADMEIVKYANSFLSQEKKLVPYFYYFTSQIPGGDRFITFEIYYILEISNYINFQNAIGYSSKNILDKRIVEKNQNDIKFLAIDGIYPTEENIKNNTYPFTYSNLLR